MFCSGSLTISLGLFNSTPTFFIHHSEINVEWEVAAWNCRHVRFELIAYLGENVYKRFGNEFQIFPAEQEEFLNTGHASLTILHTPIQALWYQLRLVDTADPLSCGDSPEFKLEEFSKKTDEGEALPLVLIVIFIFALLSFWLILMGSQRNPTLRPYDVWLCLLTQLDFWLHFSVCVSFSLQGDSLNFWLTSITMALMIVFSSAKVLELWRAGRIVPEGWVSYSLMVLSCLNLMILPLISDHNAVVESRFRIVEDIMFCILFAFFPSSSLGLILISLLLGIVTILAIVLPWLIGRMEGPPVIVPVDIMKVDPFDQEFFY
jgi:hypothetical protein